MTSGTDGGAAEATPRHSNPDITMERITAAVTAGRAGDRSGARDTLIDLRTATGG